MLRCHCPYCNHVEPYYDEEDPAGRGVCPFCDEPMDVIGEPDEDEAPQTAYDEEDDGMERNWMDEFTRYNNLREARHHAKQVEASYRDLELYLRGAGVLDMSREDRRKVLEFMGVVWRMEEDAQKALDEMRREYE